MDKPPIVLIACEVPEAVTGDYVLHLERVSDGAKITIAIPGDEFVHDGTQDDPNRILGLNLVTQDRHYR